MPISLKSQICDALSENNGQRKSIIILTDILEKISEAENDGYYVQHDITTETNKSFLFNFMLFLKSRETNGIDIHCVISKPIIKYERDWFDIELVDKNSTTIVCAEVAFAPEGTNDKTIFRILYRQDNTIHEKRVDLDNNDPATDTYIKDTISAYLINVIKGGDPSNITLGENTDNEKL